jgi:hypothetical protein
MNILFMHIKIKFVLLCTCFIYCSNCLCQHYDELYFRKKGEKINCTNNKGLKQGLWIDYTLILNCDTFIRINSFGDYKDNKKTGKWIYNKVGGVNSSVSTVGGNCKYSEIIIQEKEEQYFDNGNVKIITDHFEMEMNSDTTFFHEIIKSDNFKDKVCVECIKKGKSDLVICHLYKSNGEIRLTKTYDDLKPLFEMVEGYFSCDLP